MALNEQIINEVVLNILPQYLGPYVRRRLSDEHPDATWDTRGTQTSSEPPKLDDLSEQLFALTGRGPSGDFILKSDIELTSRLHEIRKARNRYAHQQRFADHEVLAILSQVIDVLGIIGSPEGAAEVSGVLQRYLHHLTSGSTATSASPMPGSETGVPPRTGHEQDPQAATPVATNADAAAPITSAMTNAGDITALSDRGDEAPSDHEDEPSPASPAPTHPIDALRFDIRFPEIFSYAHAVARLTPTITIDATTAPEEPSEDELSDEISAPGIDASDEEDRELLLTDPPTLHDVRVNIRIEDEGAPLITPVSFSFDVVTGSVVSTTFDAEFDHSELLSTSAESTSTLIVEYSADGETRTHTRPGPRVLSPRQWAISTNDRYSAASLSTFVQPQHPEIARLAKEASLFLMEATGSDALEGYAGGSERVADIVDALCRAFFERGVAYAVPANNWVETGQHIRTAEDVLDGGLATCLDSTLVLASALEYLDIEPLVIILEGHSVLGYWTTRTHGPEDIAMPGWRIINSIDRGEIGLIETTSLTATELPNRHMRHSAARDALGPGASNIHFVLSVHEARERGIPAQKTHTRDSDGIIIEASAPLTVRGNDITLTRPSLPRRAAVRKDRAPERVEKWKADLLDLSTRNRLINCSDSALSSHKLIELAVPEQILGAFEDLISSGESVTLSAAGDRATAAKRQGRPFGNELEPPMLAPLLADHREVQVDLSAALYDSTMRKLRASARTLIDETGANNLYLALGSLIWETKGKSLRSPLIFIPVELEYVSRNSPYRLHIDQSGSSTPNYSLLERLRVDLGLSLPELAEPIEDDAGIDLPRLFDSIRDTLSRNRLRFHVEPTTYLGIFEFGSFRLWKDLEDSWELFTRNPLVKHLIEAPGEIFTDPSDDIEIPNLEEVLLTLPIPADASQTDVVAHAVAGRSIVVEGPPGTGKSQTITNLIIRSIAQGKKVMFVAEKRAALDVVARRLKNAGVGDLVLNLHDRKLRPDDIRSALLTAAEVAVHPNTMAMSVSRQLAESARQGLERYRSAMHTPKASGLSVYLAHSTLLAYGDSSEELPMSPEELDALDSEKIEHLRRTIIPNIYRTFIDYRPGSGTLYSWLTQSVPESRRTELFETIENAQALRSLGFTDELMLRISNTSMNDLARIDSVLHTADFDPKSLPWIRSPQWTHNARELHDALDSCAAMPTPAFEYFYSSALTSDLVEIRERIIDAKNAWFGKVKKVEKALSPLAAHRTASPLPSDPEVILGIVDNLIHLQHTHNQVVDSLQKTLPSYAARWKQRWSCFDPSNRNEVDAILTWLTDVADLVPLEGEKPTPVQTLAATLFELPDRETISERVHACAEAIRQVSTAPELDDIALDTLMDAAPQGLSVEDRRRDFTARLALLEAVQPLRDLGLHTAANTLLDRRIAPESLIPALDKGLAQATESAGMMSDPLKNFTSRSHADLTSTYSTELQSIRRHIPDAVLSSVVNARASDSYSQSTRFALLKSDLERKRKKRPIRDLVSEYGDLITALTPCVLVSPDSVARFFPPERQDFDLVVFDEASQITVASAIGAMGRGRSVIVCGDSKQMPPTSFAELTRDEEDSARPIDEESILSECVAAHVPRKWLMWHYRSQDESLIAFSNSRYYKGKLSSFPSPISGTSERSPEGYGLSLRRVDGHFIRLVPRGESRKLYRTNPVEARAIVDEIRRRFTREASPSLGVVTFNIQQRDLIEQELRELDDPAITRSLDSDDGIFVKNLENVQGDERDTILFSVAFSAGSNGEMPLNFGPLNRQGGERRLNVAITRARREVILFSSFDPAELRAERSQSQGLQDLKAYLQLAHDGTGAMRNAVATHSLPDHHRDDLADALRSAGLIVSTGVGLSEFRLDLVLAKPETPDLPSVAVMLDGAGWNLRKTNYDRDILPHDVLASSMHWPHVERVWLPEWLSDRQAIIARLVELTLTTEVEHSDHTDSHSPVNRDTGVDPSRADDDDDGRVHTTGISGILDGIIPPHSPADLSDGQSHDTMSPETRIGAAEIRPLARDEKIAFQSRHFDSTPRHADLNSAPTPAPSEGAPSHDDRHERLGRHGDDASVHTYRDLSKPTVFQVADVGVRGERSLLDMAEFSSQYQNMVRETARLICALEFPIQSHRFRSLVARAFGLARMKESREEQIRSIIGTDDYVIDEYNFYWPKDVSPDSLTSYRLYAFDTLTIDEIHPRELDNLTREVLSQTWPRATRKTKIRAVFFKLGQKNHRLTEQLSRAIEGSIKRVEESSSGSIVPSP